MLFASDELGALRPLVLEVALAYGTDGCDGRGVALCSCALLVVGAPVAPPPTLLMNLLPVLGGEWGFVCVCLDVHVGACMLSRFSFVLLFVTQWTLGSSVHGALQARILEWVAVSSSRGCM